MAPNFSESDSLRKSFIENYSNPGSDQAMMERLIKERMQPEGEALMRDAQTIAPEYYSALSRTFADNEGLGSRGQSWASKIADAQFQRARLGGNMERNRGLREYWQTGVNDLIGKANTTYGLNMSAAEKAYMMKLQAEQDAYNRWLQERAYNDSRWQPGYIGVEDPRLAGGLGGALGANGGLGNTISNQMGGTNWKGTLNPQNNLRNTGMGRFRPNIPTKVK